MPGKRVACDFFRKTLNSMRTRHFASHRASVYAGLEIHNSPIRPEVSAAAMADEHLVVGLHECLQHSITCR